MVKFPETEQFIADALLVYHEICDKIGVRLNEVNKEMAVLIIAKGLMKSYSKSSLLVYDDVIQKIEFSKMTSVTKA